ncbi:MAG TPA: hypothetical protein VF861_13550 [Telluria sp.]
MNKLQQAGGRRRQAPAAEKGPVKRYVDYVNFIKISKGCVHFLQNVYSIYFLMAELSALWMYALNMDMMVRMGRKLPPEGAQQRSGKGRGPMYPGRKS